MDHLDNLQVEKYQRQSDFSNWSHLTRQRQPRLEHAVLHSVKPISDNFLAWQVRKDWNKLGGVLHNSLEQLSYPCGQNQDWQT